MLTVRMKGSYVDTSVYLDTSTASPDLRDGPSHVCPLLGDTSASLRRNKGSTGGADGETVVGKPRL